MHLVIGLSVWGARSPGVHPLFFGFRLWRSIRGVGHPGFFGTENSEKFFGHKPSQISSFQGIVVSKKMFFYVESDGDIFEAWGGPNRAVI